MRISQAIRVGRCIRESAAGLYRIGYLIACLGLFGLVTFAVEQRTKEIGIRKVLAPA